jgi:methyl-accepting chemotaxis protein
MWNSLKIRTKLTIVFGSLAFTALLAAGLTFVSFNMINKTRARILELHMADKSRIEASNFFLMYLKSPDAATLNQLSLKQEEVNSVIGNLKNKTLKPEELSSINEMEQWLNEIKLLINKLVSVEGQKKTQLELANSISVRIASEFPNFSGNMYESRYLGQRFILSGNVSDFKLWEESVLRFQSKLSNGNSDDLLPLVSQYLSVGRQFWSLIESTKTNTDGINQTERKLEAAFINLLISSTEVFNNQRSQNIKTIIGLLLVLIVGASVVSYVFSKNMSESLKRGVSFANLISEGDLKVKFDQDLLEKKDEIGDLARSLSAMGEKLTEITTGVVQSSLSITEASIQFSETSQQMSQGANMQATSTEEISASMEEIASNISQTTANSQEAEKVAIETEKGVTEGVNAAAEAMSYTNQISQKISIISDIAFQTNILALNAAVEAARAGEHGKGFAVVAAEVRKLAERSGNSAQEIDSMANKLKLASDRANQKLSSVIPLVKNNLKLIQEISAASMEQASGADQVNNALQQLNQIVQQNAAASEELATSADEMKNQAENLKDIIVFFKL